MSFETTRRDIAARLEAGWITTRVSYPNQKFNEPTVNESWVKLRIFEDGTQRINIGKNGVHRQNGTIALEIYTPQDTGEKPMRDIADPLAVLFRDVQFNGITCRESQLAIVGDNRGWYQANLSIGFFVDAVYTV